MNRSTIRQGVWAGSLLLLVAAVGLSFGPAASAATPSDDGSGYVRLGHFAPSQGPVDVVVDGKVVARNIDYRGITDYLKVTAGTHKFSLQPPGSTGAPILSVDAGVPADGAVTIGAVTTRTGLAVQVYDDDLKAPPAGEALVRFLPTAPAVSAVDVSVVGGPTLAQDLEYPKATEYQAIKAGTYDLQITSDETKEVVLRVPGWEVKAGSQCSVVIIQTADGKLDVVPVTDAIGVPAAPQGGMATGLGGLADPPPNSGTPLVLWGFAASALLLALASLATGTAHRRRL